MTTDFYALRRQLASRRPLGSARARWGLLCLLLPLLALTAQAQPCATGNPTPNGDVALPAVRLRQSFTQPCTGVLQNVTFTPVQSLNTTIANIIYDMRRSGYFVRCNLKNAAGNTLATTPGTNQWFPGATIVFNFSAANLLLTTGTVYSWELEETTGTAVLNLLHCSPLNTDEYPGGSLTQDGVNRRQDARKWAVNTVPAVVAGPIAGPLCAGAAVSVPFTAHGPVRAGNVYTAQLSNASGSFAAPVSIGTLSSTAASGTVAATVPAGTATGTGYRVRVLASTAGFAPVPNPSDLTLNGTAAPAGAASQRFTPGATVSDLAATGTAVKWYAASSGGAALAPTTLLVNGTVYYATQTVGGFETCSRLAVRADVMAVAPTVTTAAATLVAGTTATLGGDVTADGGAALTARGVVYSTTNTAPTLSGANVTTAPATLGTGTGSFTVPVAGLGVGTRYYVRAYATNAQGTSYGGVQQFTPAYPYRALALTGFTDDVVTEGSVFSNSPLNLTSNTFDGGSPGYVLYERGYVSVNTAPRGLPVGGSFSSAVTAGLPYQFGSYNGGNSLRLAVGGSGTLTPGPRPVAKTLYVLASSGAAATAMTLTLNFVGGGSQTTTSLPVANWLGGSGAALAGFDRVQRTTTTSQAPENNSGDPRLYEIAVPIATGNQNSILSSVTVRNTGGGSGILNVMALSVELTPMLLTQATTYDNALQLVTVPAGTTATAQGWGGGGGGNGSGFSRDGGGGGGGYTTAVLGAGDYVLTTGAGGATSGDGNGAASVLTGASGTPVLLAAGGFSGLNGGAGGRAADSTPGSPNAVSGTNGGSVSIINGILTGGIGGTAGGPGGGAGGAGGRGRANGAPGAAPGGGGGGSFGVNSAGFRSAGGAGRLVLTPAPVLASLSAPGVAVGSPLTLTGSNLAGATTVTFTGTSGNTVTAALAVSGTNPTQTLAVTVPSGAQTGTVTVTTMGGTSNGLTFTVSSSLPLPVELMQFTATAEGSRSVRLAWATSSEKNSARFEVERSLDGRTFAGVGTVAAAGSSSTPRQYELLDKQLPAGARLLYYRLRQVDQDGTFSHSPVRSVALAGAAAGLSLYPNPTPGSAATLAGAATGAAVMVYDALGRPVATATADASGTAALALPPGLAAGVYVVRVGSQAIRLTVE